MTAPQGTGTEPVRTSPLRERHRALGAEWVSDAVQWPRRYGGAAGDIAARGGAVWLADVGPLDKVVLTGMRRSAAPPAPQLVPSAIGEGRVGARSAQLWDIGSDEALLLVPSAESGAAAALVGALRAEGLKAEDQSSQYVLLALGGPGARLVLAALSPVDTSANELPDRGVVFGTLALVRVTIGRLDRRGVPAFMILAERDYAVYLWDALMEAGAPHGIRPVGAAALEGV